ncbi:hypothetical protein BV898_02739 [Hypsibius exemplaris]|uniref:Uncharacterized protein n=1 Tax=Hypsibius exemplaris TaxID=2072580 RepID=A0A1W0X6X3_HYPEX|nr:hypothetical protein BV898_02739 [Hypsibius exemplaris]
MILIAWLRTEKETINPDGSDKNGNADRQHSENYVAVSSSSETDRLTLQYYLTVSVLRLSSVYQSSGPSNLSNIVPASI